MTRLFACLLALLLGACTTTPPPRIVIKTESVPYDRIKYVEIPQTLTDTSTIPVPSAAPRDAVWKDPDTGIERPTARLGPLTIEASGLREALDVCLGRLQSIATIKPKEK